mgnify:CR=1 FL=1
MLLRCDFFQIRVNAIHPHIVLTEMGKRGWADPVKHNKYLIRTPIGRLAGKMISMMMKVIMIAMMRMMMIIKVMN